MDIIKLSDFPENPVQDQIYEIIPDKSKIVASTNRLFNKYPTRYISAVPRFPILKYSCKGDLVLDPFCGSGTTAIEAMLNGRNALSIDIDPFARLLIKVKTTVYSEKAIDIIRKIVAELKQQTVEKQTEYSLPGIPNIEKWFCNKSMLGLSFLKHWIDKLANEDEDVRDYLYIVLAAIIRKSSNADDVSPKPYISTRYPKNPADPIELFFKTEEMYRDAIIHFSNSVRQYGCSSIILESNDARDIGNASKVDLAVTSPPYINAYDYVRSLRFEDLWLGLANEEQLRERKKAYIGTESAKSFYNKYRFASQSATLSPLVDEIRKVDPKRAEIVSTYFEDMALNMISVRKRLKKHGCYAIVVGDSNIRGQAIPTAKILTDMAVQNGYSFELSFKYVIRDRYLHLPRGGRGGIINYDEILILRKN